MRANNLSVAQAIDTAPLNRGLKGADWLASPGNMPVIFPNGDVMLFDYEAPGEFQVHVLFVSRGKKAIEHVREAFRTMFNEHGASLIFGMVPEFRRDVKMLARWTGMRSAGLRATNHGPCELFILSKFQWKVANQ